MPTKIFQVLTKEDTRYGKDLVTAVATIYPGLLVNFASSGATLALGAAATKPEGFAFGLRHSIYRPTSTTFAAAEPVVIMQGSGDALLSYDYFSSGSLPVAGNDLYSAADGLIATTGTHKFGHCIKQVTWVQGIGGTGTTATCALIRFNFDSFA